jgi:hypothetical protein
MRGPLSCGSHPYAVPLIALLLAGLLITFMLTTQRSQTA